ncbi:MAG: class I SAM-dependent methyltransferase [Ilumatobacteraceae bacterium]
MRDEDFEHLHHLEDTYWWFVGMRDVQAALLDPVVESARAALRLPHSRVVLDLGCGTGANLSWLRRYTAGAPAGGLDVVEQALQFCRSRDEHQVVLASATDLPYASGSCDVAGSFDVLVQIPGDDGPVHAMAEMFRVLRPGGVAFVRCAAYGWMRSAHDEALHTQRRYTRHELAALAVEAGFDVVRSTYANTLLFPIAALRRLVLMRVRLTEATSDVRPMPKRLQWANRLLVGALRLEARVLGRPRARLPFGLSAIIVVRKPVSGV